MRRRGKFRAGPCAKTGQERVHRLARFATAFGTFLFLMFALSIDVAQAQQPAGCRTVGSDIFCDSCADAQNAPLGSRQVTLNPDVSVTGDIVANNNSFCDIPNLGPGDRLTMTVEDSGSDQIASFQTDFTRVGPTPASLSPPSVLGVNIAVPGGSASQSFAHSEPGATATRVNASITGVDATNEEFAVFAKVTCTCTPATGRLTINKAATGGDDTFAIDATPNAGGAAIDYNITTTGGSGSLSLTIPTGTYTISEVVPAGWNLDNIVCGGQNTDQAIVSPNATTTCTVTNSKPGNGTLTVRKLTIGGDDDFSFSVTGQPGFNLSNGGQRRFTNLPPGQYTIREANLPAGWQLQNVSCTGGGNRQGDGITVGLSVNQAITCTFTNFKERDERMRDVTRVFIHRRVDNLLSHDPGRSRILQRLQQGDPPPSLKDSAPPPLKLGGRPAARLGGVGTALLPAYARPLEDDTQYGLFAAQDQDDQPWKPGSGQSSPMLSSIMGQLAGAAGGSGSFKFGTSLSELRQSAATAELQAQQTKLKEAGLDFNGKYLANPYLNMRQGFDFWVEGQVSRYNDSTGGIGREGSFRILYIGADYALAPGVLVGALVQIDDTREAVEDPTLIGEVDGTGWMAGPYIGIRLTNNLFFDARAAWGRSDNDIWLSDDVTGRRSGSFGTDRWLTSATLTGNHQFGAWRFSPEIGIAYGNESYDRYFNTLGQVVDGGQGAIGRVTGGVEVGYQARQRNGSIFEPFVGIKGIWNFYTEDLLVGGALLDLDESRARLEGGFTYTMLSGWAVRGAAGYDGIGAGDFEAYTGQLWVNVPLN